MFGRGGKRAAVFYNAADRHSASAGALAMRCADPGLPGAGGLFGDCWQ